MLIINADDLGRNATTTDNILICHKQGRITSASIMLFMKDSFRAAENANKDGLATGLHLNLDLPFESPAAPAHLIMCQARLIRFFRFARFMQVIYNPFLKNDFDYVFKTQYEEYFSLFGQEPAQIDGHHHYHLCMNILIDRLIPRGSRIRRNFTFDAGEKSFFNRLYRQFVDNRLALRYRLADALFGIEPINDLPRLSRIVQRASSSGIEIIVHPGISEQYIFLMSERFGNLIATAPKGNYRMLGNKDE